VILLGKMHGVLLEEIQNDDELISNVLFPGETLLWAHRAPMPRDAKLGYISSILLSFVFLIIMGFAAAIIGAHFFLFFTFLPPFFLLFFVGLYIFWSNSGDNFNILTNTRAINCMLKRGQFVRVKSVPYSLIDGIDMVSATDVEFKIRVFTTSLSLDEEKAEDIRRRKGQNFRFEQVGDSSEIERIARANMEGKTYVAESGESETPSYFEQTKSTVHSDHLNWPPKFQQLLNLGLEYSDEDETTIAEDSTKEHILWSYKPSRWSLYRRYVVVGVIFEIIIIALCVSIKYPMLILLGTVVTILSVLMSLGVSFGFEQAFVVTNKSILIFRTGFPKIKPTPPDVVLNHGFSHCIKITYARAYPMVSSLQMRFGSGEMWFASQQLAGVKIYVPDMRTVQRMIYEGFLLNNKPTRTVPKRTEDPDARFQIE